MVYPRSVYYFPSMYEERCSEGGRHKWGPWKIGYRFARYTFPVSDEKESYHYCVCTKCGRYAENK